jgi:lysophospholipase L1-like esterase
VQSIWCFTAAGLQTSACSDRLFGVNLATGAVVLDVAIGVSPSNGGRLRNGGSVAWTYGDRIAVVNRSGLLQEYDYSGTPLLATPVSFVPSQYFAISQLAANDQGTIFAFGSGDGFQTGTLLFYKADGTSGSVTIAIPYPGVDVYQLQPTADGNMTGIPYGTAGRVDHIDLGSQTVTSSNLVPSTSGYASSAIIDYVTDAAGNALVHWSQSTGNDKASSVDLYDSASSGVSNIFLKQKKMADLANYPDFYDMGDAQLKNAIGGGSVYLLVCENATSVCFSQSATTTINKVSVGNFGTPLGKGFKRNTYSSQKLQYVAMGDSYSSGEGNPPFNPWTDRSGVNECHRSEDTAYPQWLVKHSGLNLELADFVACSGATTDTVLNGGSGTGAWSEAPQVDSLSSTTDRVTITIGGNDVGFGDVLNQCVASVTTGNQWGCSVNSTLVSDVGQRLAALASPSEVSLVGGKNIHSITSVLTAIASKAPNAALYIAGYPRLFGSDTANFTQDASAPGGFYCDTSTSTFAYADTEWMNQKADQLNQVIIDAVTAAKSSGMNVTYVPPALFAGHGLCDSGNSYIYGVMLGSTTTGPPNPGSVHPDQNGQNIAYGQMFEAMMQ